MTGGGRAGGRLDCPPPQGKVETHPCSATYKFTPNQASDSMTDNLNISLTRAGAYTSPNCSIQPVKGTV